MVDRRRHHRVGKAIRHDLLFERHELSALALLAQLIGLSDPLVLLGQHVRHALIDLRRALRALALRVRSQTAANAGNRALVALKDRRVQRLVVVREFSADRLVVEPLRVGNLGKHLGVGHDAGNGQAGDLARRLQHRGNRAVGRGLLLVFADKVIVKGQRRLAQADQPLKAHHFWRVVVQQHVLGLRRKRDQVDHIHVVQPRAQEFICVLL